LVHYRVKVILSSYGWQDLKFNILSKPWPFSIITSFQIWRCSITGVHRLCSITEIHKLTKECQEQLLLSKIRHLKYLTYICLSLLIFFIIIFFSQFLFCIIRIYLVNRTMQVFFLSFLNKCQYLCWCICKCKTYCMKKVLKKI
jgi:hypothetical protein